LRVLATANPDALANRLALTEGLLLSASVTSADSDNDMTLTKCRQARDMLEADAKTTNNYQILDPWVRVNYCLQNGAPAKNGVERLQSIGYRDSSFVLLTQTNQGTQ
jgi:hypothetical protein